jgi:hypothetical protein
MACTTAQRRLSLDLYSERLSLAAVDARIDALVVGGCRRLGGGCRWLVRWLDQRSLSLGSMRLCGAVDARIDALGVVCVDSIGGSMRAVDAMG